MACIFLTNAILAEIIGVKIFSLEKTLGLPAAQIQMLGSWVLNFDLSAGVMLWPVVFITTDVINEYFGKAGVKRITLLTTVFIAYVFLMLGIVTALAPADFWVSMNQTDSAGNHLNIHEAFNRIFGQSMGIIVGSLVAFVVGQIIDASSFQFMRRLTKGNWLWLRATGSTIISQLTDSFLVITIAFKLFGNPPWSWEQILSVGSLGYAYKFLVAVVSTPILYLAHYFIVRYLGKEHSEQISRQASQTVFFKNSKV